MWARRHQSQSRPRNVGLLSGEPIAARNLTVASAAAVMREPDARSTSETREAERHMMSSNPFQRRRRSVTGPGRHASSDVSGRVDPATSTVAAAPTTSSRVMRVAIGGDLDVATSACLRERVLPLAEGRERIELDLRAVPFVDMCGARALGALCDELQRRRVELAVVPSSSMARLLDRLAEAGLPLHLPITAETASTDDAELDIASLTLSARALRPVEARVLRLLDEGLTPPEVAFRFQRSVRWVHQVATLGRQRLGQEHTAHRGTDRILRAVEAPPGSGRAAP